MSYHWQVGAIRLEPDRVRKCVYVTVAGIISVKLTASEAISFALSVYQCYQEACTRWTQTLGQVPDIAHKSGFWED